MRLLDAELSAGKVSDVERHEADRRGERENMERGLN